MYHARVTCLIVSINNEGWVRARLCSSGVQLVLRECRSTGVRSSRMHGKLNRTEFVPVDVACVDVNYTGTWLIIVSLKSSSCVITFWQSESLHTRALVVRIWAEGYILASRYGLFVIIANIHRVWSERKGLARGFDFNTDLSENHTDVSCQVMRNISKRCCSSIFQWICTYA